MGTIIDRRRAIMGSGGDAPVLPYEEQYLTFEALEAGTFTFSIDAGIGTGRINGATSYSIDNGATWNSYNYDNTALTITTPTLQKGEKVLWKGIARTYYNNSCYSKFSSTGNYKVYGNIMSLLYGDSFIDKTSLYTSYVSTFSYLFKENTNLADVKNLIMPATTLANNCYSQMFYGCTNIKESPILPAETLTSYCYNQMFNGCTSLNKITCLAVTTASRSTYQWVASVSATGTFYKNANKTDWASGISGIPSGWTVIDT